MAGFGFTPGDDFDENQRENLEEMMRQMQEQIQAQFQQLGFAAMPGAMPGAMSGVMGTPAEILPQKTVRDTARKFVQTSGCQPIGTNDVTAISNACQIADIWLNESTLFPATTPQSQIAISRLDWVDATLAGWQETMTPLAQGLTDAIGRLLADAMRDQSNEMAGAPAPVEAIAAMLKSFIGTMIATQLGQAVGSIAATSTGAHDAALPILEPAHPLLIPENIEAWGADSEIAKTEIYLFHALRESAIARLFAHNPWIVSYIRSSIAEYGAGIHIDLDAITRQAEEVMNGNIEESFTIELNKGLFTPEETPQQKLALTKLETVLALVDGWADDVATQAAGDRIPSITSLRELHRRSRAESSPSTHLFKTLLGLEVSPRLAREASAFFSRIREVKGVEGRDAMWSGILPTANELLAPDLFIESTQIPDDPSSLF